jgi:hypothetical protein
MRISFLASLCTISFLFLSTKINAQSQPVQRVEVVNQKPIPVTIMGGMVSTQQNEKIETFTGTVNVEVAVSDSEKLIIEYLNASTDGAISGHRNLYLNVWNSSDVSKNPAYRIYFPYQPTSGAFSEKVCIALGPNQFARFTCDAQVGSVVLITTRRWTLK